MRNIYKNLKGVVAILALAFIGISLSSAQVNVTLKVDMSAENDSTPYVTGTFTDEGDGNWSILEMTPEEDTDIFSIELTDLTPGDTVTYYFLNGNDWGNREDIPEECLGGAWDNHRGFEVPQQDTIIGYVYAGCETLGEATTVNAVSSEVSAKVYPNPVSDVLYIKFDASQESADVKIYSMNGNLVLSQQKPAGDAQVTINTNQLPKGVYLVKISSSKGSSVQKISVK